MSKIEQYYYLYTPSSEISVKEKSQFEEYASKINLEYEVIESFVPVISDEERERMCEKYFPYSLPLEKNVYRPLGGGTGACTFSHYYMWQKIIDTNKTTAILEHDTRPLINFSHLDIPDFYIILLGPRVMDIKGYMPNRKADGYYKVEHHGGSAAYVITPKTAEVLLSHIKEHGYYDCIDNTFFMRIKDKNVSKFLDVPLLAADPPPCVTVVGEKNEVKKSSIKRSSDNGLSSIHNFYITPGFNEGKK